MVLQRRKKMAIFALNASHWNHALGGPLPKPFSYYPIPDVRYAEGGELPSGVKKKKKKTVEVNPFIYANSTKSGGNWDQGFAKQFNDSIIANKNNISFSPEAIAYVIGSESGYDKFASNKISSAVGPIQLLKGSLIDMYGDEAGKVAHQEYIDKVRSDTNIIHDTMNYLKMVEGKVNKNVGDMSAGRLKQNLLSPNHPITKVIPSSVFNSSIPKQIKSNLTLGKSTYQDYINEFNRGYNEFYNAYLDSLNKN